MPWLLPDTSTFLRGYKVVVTMLQELATVLSSIHHLLLLITIHVSGTTATCHDAAGYTRTHASGGPPSTARKEANRREM
ncbi:unnamed protein product [Dibothriocephalus latus]|uniref:Uncharacterized protein n=1 Tax=Dibothriocephalus latus TaxID=60516 RepID=A0A3P6P286_DIBLA|nr:unnamed protein product [Dibothriocephalus latus]